VQQQQPSPPKRRSIAVKKRRCAVYYYYSSLLLLSHIRQNIYWKNKKPFAVVPLLDVDELIMEDHL